MKPATHLLDKFRVSRIDADRPSLYIQVEIHADYESLRKRARELNRDKKFKTCLALFQSDLEVGQVWGRSYRVVGDSRRIGVMLLARGPKMELFAMHESVHAAFALSRWQMKWDYANEGEREEFIARSAEFIYEKIRARLKDNNQYRPRHRWRGEGGYV